MFRTEKTNKSISGDFNPLMVDLVLDNIFDHLLTSVETIVEIRLVCHKWNEIALTKLKKGINQFKIVFEIPNSNTAGNEEEDELSINEYILKVPENDPNLTLLPKYINYVMEFPSLVFSNFIFRDISLQHELIVNKFYINFGHSVTQIEFDFGNSYSLDGILNVATFKNFLSHCPNLRELILSSFPDDELFRKFRSCDIGDIPIITNIKTLRLRQLAFPAPTILSFLQQMYSICPSLTSLSIDTWFGALDAPILNPSHFNMTELSLPRLPSEDSDFRILTQMRLKWLKFNDFYLEDGSPEKLLLILNSQKESLEKILLWNIIPRYSTSENDNDVPFLTFPAMPKLKLLRMGIPSETKKKNIVNFSPMDFANFPCLQTFILMGDVDSCNIENILGQSNKQFWNVTGLKVPKGLNPSHVRQAGRMFPMVKDLVLGLTCNESIRCIWTQWPELQSLFLFVGFQEDESITPDMLFTGLDSVQCKEILKLKNPLNYKPTMKSESTSISIANLKKLRALAVHSISEKHKVTNASIFSFAQLSSLEFIRIEQGGITAEGEAAIQEALPNVLFSTKYMPLFDGEKDCSSSYKEYPLCNADIRHFYK